MQSKPSKSVVLNIKATFVKNDNIMATPYFSNQFPSRTLWISWIISLPLMDYSHFCASLLEVLSYSEYYPCLYESCFLNFPKNETFTILLLSWLALIYDIFNQVQHERNRYMSLGERSREAGYFRVKHYYLCSRVNSQKHYGYRQPLEWLHFIHIYWISFQRLGLLFRENEWYSNTM